MTARDLMTSNPATVTPRSRVADAWDLMRELDVRHVPVVHDGVLVGMLSDRDVAHVSTRLACWRPRRLTHSGASLSHRSSPS